MHVFEEPLRASWPPESWQDRTVLVAVSGGADSVALLRGLQRLKAGGAGKLVVGHFNHRLRGAASDADARFVTELAERFGLPLVLERREDTGAASEERLRDERLAFLQHAAEAQGARYVVTAHTADDQAETILHRIVRGTGIAGLAGIRRTRLLGEAAMLLRPMLEISRAEVLAYLDALGQPYREDASNLRLAYSRNRIRHELLPQLARDYNPRVVEAILRLGRLSGEAHAIVEGAVAALVGQCVLARSETEVRVCCERLSGTSAAMIRELFHSLWREQQWPLADMGLAEWDRLASLAMQDASQTIDLPGPVRVQKKGVQLTLIRSASDT